MYLTAARVLLVAPALIIGAHTHDYNPILSDYLGFFFLLLLPHFVLRLSINRTRSQPSHATTRTAPLSYCVASPSGALSHLLSQPNLSLSETSQPSSFSFCLSRRASLPGSTAITASTASIQVSASSHSQVFSSSLSLSVNLGSVNLERKANQCQYTYTLPLSLWFSGILHCGSQLFFCF